MSLLRHRSPEKLPAGRDPLEFLGAEQHGLPRGCWVYVLHQADGTPFRVGQSKSLISRLHEHIGTYKGRFHHYSLISCRDEHQMDVYELFLIDWFQKQGLVNIAGTAEIEQLRRRVRLASAGSGLGAARRHQEEKTG